MARFGHPLLGALVGLFTIAGAAACGGPGQVAPAGPVPLRSHDFRVDAAHHAIDLLLVAGAGHGGFNFNGFSNGRLEVTVPAGWVVRLTFVNRSPLPNSVAVVTGPHATTPAFPGAGLAPRLLREGVAEGQGAHVTFVADRPGSYRIASLVAGHELSGMWIRFRVVTRGHPAYVRLP